MPLQTGCRSHGRALDHDGDDASRPVAYTVASFEPPGLRLCRCELAQPIFTFSAPHSGNHDGEDASDAGTSVTILVPYRPQPTVLSRQDVHWQTDAEHDDEQK